MLKNKIIIFSNYKRNNKWLGIIDYKLLTIIVIYIFLILIILRYINLKLEYTLYILSIFLTPVIAIVCITIQNGDGLDVLYTIFKFYLTNDIYIKMKYYKKLNKKVYKKRHNLSKFVF